MGRRGRRPPMENRRYKDLRAAAAQRSMGMCEATDMHHPDCPGWGTACHHILPEAKAFALGLDWDDIDILDNVMWVWADWNGSGGCHARIHHGDPARARELGYLRDRPETAGGA